MFVTVRHLNQEDYSKFHGLLRDEQYKFIKDTFKNNRYERVADIVLGGTESNILSEAFTLTNTVVTPWYENPNVQVHEMFKDGCRSTSIGDIIQINGETYVVDTFGFKHIDDI